MWLSVAKPSGGGLKLDLDRYRRDAEELIREMKRDADQIVAQAKETIEMAETGRRRNLTSAHVTAKRCPRA